MKLDPQFHSPGESELNGGRVIEVAIRLIEDTRIPTGEPVEPLLRAPFVEPDERAEGMRLGLFADGTERLGVQGGPEARFGEGSLSEWHFSSSSAIRCDLHKAKAELLHEFCGRNDNDTGPGARRVVDQVPDGRQSARKPQERAELALESCIGLHAPIENGKWQPMGGGCKVSLGWQR